MDRLEKNPLELIKTGNIVKVNSTSGFVEVELKNDDGTREMNWSVGDRDNLGL